MTTITPLSPPSELALAIRPYFDELPADLDNYLTSTPNDDATRPLRERLISALDFDIDDMLHNANLADLIPATESLNDDDFDELSDRLLDDNNYIPILADLILASATTI